MKELTKENLLESVSQEEIFEYYLGIKPEIGINYCNPLREDNNPGCWFWYNRDDILFLIDNTQRREFGGDCFEIVRKVTGVENFFHILQRINNDFRIGLYDGYFHDYQSQERVAKVVIKKKPVVSDIRYKHMPFQYADLQWWNQYGIGKELLERFEVSCIYKVWINMNLYHKYSTLDPVYAYAFDNHSKIYRPMATRKYKWRSNCNVNDINGYKQLPKTGKLLIITKAMKDVMTLTSLGFNTIAPQAEYPVLPEKLVKELKERFEDLYVFYDNDEAGVHNSQRLTKDIGAKYVNIPKTMPKDASDFV